jgi:hypothetical protein
MNKMDYSLPLLHKNKLEPNNNNLHMASTQ